MQQKNISKTSFFSNLKQYFFTLLGLVLLALISYPLAKNISQRHKIDSEIAQLEKDIKDFEAKNNNLKGVIDYMRSDQFIEEQARLKFGLKKPGENVIAVKDDDNAQNAADDGRGAKEQVFTVVGLDKSKSKKIGNPAKWWNYFFTGTKIGV